jgi:AcrR family transcriptional regulator
MTTKERILAAAKAAFAAEGIGGVSVRAVAGKVGITPMAVYRHFADKDALISALVMDGLGAWEARVRRRKGATALQRVENIIDQFIDFALKEPRTFEAAFLVPGREARKFPDDFEMGRSPAVALLQADMEEVLRARGLAASPAAALEIWLMLWGLGQGLVALQRAGRMAGDPRAFRDLARKLLRRSLYASLSEGMS